MPPPDPASEPPPVERRVAKIADGFITVTADVPREPAGPKATIIGPVVDPQALLAAGAIVVQFRVNWELLSGFAPKTPGQAPTAPTGHAVGKWLLAAPTAKTVGQGWFGFIAYNGGDAMRQVVDHLLTIPDVDPSRLAIAGSSTGGFTALEAIVNEPRIKVAAVLSACGDYFDFLHRSTLAMEGKPLDLDAKYAATLRARQPIAHPKRVTHAALLMVHGRRDLVVPFSCARRTAAVFRRAYAKAGAPERFRFVVLPDEGHGLDAEGRRAILAWWRRWLSLPIPEDPAPAVTSALRPVAPHPERPQRLGDERAVAAHDLALGYGDRAP